MKLMDANTRKKIDAAIEKAASLASTGMNPNEAIVKVALENSYNPDIGRLMARNFNISKTLAHFATFKKDSEKRAGDFDVADAELVASKLQDNIVKSSTKAASVPKPLALDNFLTDSISADEYLSKYAPTKKVASEDIDIFVLERYLREKSRVAEKTAELKSKAGQAGTAAQFKLVAIADEVRRTGKFAELEADVIHALGEKTAKGIFDSIEELVPFKNFKFTRAVAPSDLITYPAVVKMSEELLQNLEDLNTYTKAHNKLAEDAGLITDPEMLGGFSIGTNIGNAVNTATSDTIKTIKDFIGEPKTKSPVSKDDLRFTKSLESEVERAKASAVLSEILSDDDVLSQEDPSLVAEMAKKQLELNPKLINYPAVLAGTIRRAIATGGDMDPFQGRQLINLTKTVID